MTAEGSEDRPRGKARESDRREARRAREAAALRANLHRRKDQARARSGDGSKAPPKPPED